jgi:hypothetical protein
MRTRTGVSLAIAGVLAVALGGGRVSSDGSESLGPASVTLAAGTGIASGGTGMMSQPGVINVDVPDGAVVKQVLLYWEGFMATNVAGDDTISISNGGPSTSVTGTLVGGPTLFFSGAYASVFRADITSLGMVAAGSNALTVDGLNFTTASNGAGVLVIFDDGSTPTTIDIRDGSDLAFEGFAGPLQTTVAQTFTFASSTQDRTAQLHMFFASVSGTVSGFGVRPTAIEITTNGPNGGTTVLNNLLDSVDGQEWDSFDISADIPADATTLTVQAFSRDDLGTGGLPASFDWLAAGFAIEPDVPPGVPGRMTGGGSVFTIDDVRVTRGFEIHCDLREPNNLEVNWPGNKFHTTELTSAVCLDSPAIEEPPAAPFDTFIGTGVGKLNNKPGARIEFTFVDAGEPGVFDTARIKVYDANNNLVLDVPGDPNLPGYLDKGNIQAHKDNKSLF